jgi:hypothetical protein
MNPTEPKAAGRGLAAGCFAACLAGMACLAPAWADPAAAAAPRWEGMARHHAQHVQERLDELAARLEIKASQEPAWQAFSGSVRDLMTPPHVQGKSDSQPAQGAAAPELDAAALAREHANRAAEHAQKLARLADATAKLQQVLGSDQRLVLDEAARRFSHWHHHLAGMGPGGDHGVPGWHRDGDGARGPGEHVDGRDDGDGRDGMMH